MTTLQPIDTIDKQGAGLRGSIAWYIVSQLPNPSKHFECPFTMKNQCMLVLLSFYNIHPRVMPVIVKFHIVLWKRYGSRNPCPWRLQFGLTLCGMAGASATCCLSCCFCADNRAFRDCSCAACCRLVWWLCLSYRFPTILGIHDQRFCFQFQSKMHLSFGYSLGARCCF